ncbi:hypothetical protein FOZ61_001825 [Perkinsus olseni]|uniref:Uncharacterized protein n=1 Tax=Perkinsus olseni TaxID=32597 RepID=A0A7J6KQA5_PEROL|nr:hypothetical protein FOZ61_001825 [Perkinsus olseni]
MFVLSFKRSVTDRGQAIILSTMGTGVVAAGLTLCMIRILSTVAFLEVVSNSDDGDGEDIYSLAREALIGDEDLTYPAPAPNEIDSLKARIVELEAKLAGDHGSGKSPSLEGVSGRLFTEDIKREFTGRRIFDGSVSDEGAPKNGTIGSKCSGGEPCCSNWIAITTISEDLPDGPRVAADVMLITGNWCMVVAGDKKGPRELWPELKKHVAASRAVFLNDEDQVAIGGAFAEELPWKHFGRKNIAYLYALVHGAEKILDLDDDNIIYTDSVEDITNGVFNGDCCPDKVPTTVSATSAVPSVFNPYNTWARKVAVVQTLADHDPDFDAIYRLTRPLPVDFHQLTTSAFLLNPPAFTPLNAQACLFRDYDALWGLYLPVTVHGRVSDIWRSFVLQRLLWDLGASVAVAGGTWVRQLRNSHDYLADFIAEDDVYKKSEAMMKFLAEWVPTSGTLPARLEEVYVELYRRGFVEEDEVSMR